MFLFSFQTFANVFKGEVAKLKKKCLSEMSAGNFFQTSPCIMMSVQAFRQSTSALSFPAVYVEFIGRALRSIVTS